MGAKLSGPGGQGGKTVEQNSDINVTPFVDVMLVLLIIFMVAAPMMTAGVPVDLPKSAAADMPSQTQPITVAVTPEGAIFVDETPVDETSLIATVSALATPEDRIFLRGDTTANYGAVMRVMGLLSSAGYSKIGLVTEREQ